MSRSSKKLPFVEKSVMNQISLFQNGKIKQIKTKSRASTIYPNFVGLIVNVYNGKIYIPVSVTADKVGHKLGEFSPTRKYPNHKSKVDK